MPGSRCATLGYNPTLRRKPIASDSLSLQQHFLSPLMAWRGSLSRSIISTARASALRSSAPIPRVRPPLLSTPRLRPRRMSFTNPRTMGELGCAQSLMPLHSMGGVGLTSHLAVNPRACCELSHGMERMGDGAAVSSIQD